MEIALVCIAKNEDNYIDEWIAYHLKLGFTAVFVYQNNWRYTGTDFANDDRVTFIAWDGQVKQLAAYNDFIMTKSAKFDFAAFFDVDEFLSIKNNTLLDWLGKFRCNPAIGINWRYFGNHMTSNQSRSRYSLITRFINAGRTLNKHIKTIVNLRLIRDMHERIYFYNPHCVNVYTVSADLKYMFTGPFLERTSDDVSDGIQLNHYYCKTECEFIENKISKGIPDFPEDSPHQPYNNKSEMLQHFNECNQNDIVDTTAYDFYTQEG